MGGNLWSALKQGNAAGVLAGGFPYAGSVWYVAGGSVAAPAFGRRVESLDKLFDAMTAGDIAFLGPGFYDVGNLIIPTSLSNITLIGAGNRGSAGIQSTVVGKEGLQVKANDVTLMNIGIEVEDTADYALNLLASRPGGTGTKFGSRFRAYGCKFEGPTGPAVLLNGDANYNIGDVLFEDCEFAWCGTGIRLSSSGFGVNTQIRIQNSWFHNFTAAGLDAAVLADWVVANLCLYDNKFDQQEDGTEPTDFILLSNNANTGHIAGNQFAIATNAAAKLTIGTGLMWGPNGTEAGWSTARPV